MAKHPFRTLQTSHLMDAGSPCEMAEGVVKALGDVNVLCSYALNLELFFCFRQSEDKLYFSKEADKNINFKKHKELDVTLGNKLFTKCRQEPCSNPMGLCTLAWTRDLRLGIPPSTPEHVGPEQFPARYKSITTKLKTTTEYFRSFGNPVTEFPTVLGN